MNKRFLTLDSSEGNSGKVQLLGLAAIRCDCGTQIRTSIHESTVDEYTEAMKEGADFPPLVVFHDGSQYVLADGFHRFMAASRRGYSQFSAEIHPGTKSDALKYALRANSKHGLKRTNADKRRSVELALAEWPTLSNRELARVCAVHHDLVGEVRKAQVAESASSLPETRIGGDGKERRLPGRLPNSISRAEVAEFDSDSESGFDSDLESLCDETLKAQIETNRDELQEILSRPLVGIQEGVAYHLNVVREDVKLILDSFEEDRVDPQQLLAAAVQLEFLTQLLKALAQRCAGVPQHN